MRFEKIAKERIKKLKKILAKLTSSDITGLIYVGRGRKILKQKDLFIVKRATERHKPGCSAPNVTGTVFSYNTIKLSVLDAMLTLLQETNILDNIFIKEIHVNKYK